MKTKKATVKSATAPYLLGSKPVLTLEELSVYTGYSKSSLYKMVCSNQIPHSSPIGRRKLFFDREKIDQWLLSNPAVMQDEIEKAAIDYITLNPVRIGGRL